MFRESPPRGYLGQEFPLHHDYEFAFTLHAEDETKNSTIVPILIQDLAAGTMSSTIVNPRHGSFVVSAEVNCFPESIIPRLNVSYRCSLTKGAIETDAVRSLSLNVMPIYTAFLNRLDAEDHRTGTDCENLLELTHETTDEQCFPLWSGVDLTNGSLLPTKVPGLTASQVIESVAFDKKPSLMLCNTIQIKIC